jgi:hypothetical protein
MIWIMKTVCWPNGDHERLLMDDAAENKINIIK